LGMFPKYMEFGDRYLIMAYMSMISDTLVTVKASKDVIHAII